MVRRSVPILELLYEPRDGPRGECGGRSTIIAFRHPLPTLRECAKDEASEHSACATASPAPALTANTSSIRLVASKKSNQWVHPYMRSRQIGFVKAPSPAMSHTAKRAHVQPGVSNTHEYS